ncbi:septum formation initiator [Saccharomonospora sp. NPDC006951]
MTAPARSRTRAQQSTRTRQRAKPSAPEKAEKFFDEREAESPARRRSSAAERAYARRAQRAKEVQRAKTPEPSAQRVKLRWPRSRASFVLLLMALMVAGVATTLWLSTQAIADSYRLEQLRQDNGHLAERAERLQREVSTAKSPYSLAERAKQLGMVPGGNPARIVVGADGSTRVVGEPVEATAPAPPPQRTPSSEGNAGNGEDADNADDAGREEQRQGEQAANEERGQDQSRDSEQEPADREQDGQGGE